MSNYNKADFECASLFDPQYFSRQDDLLNVFKTANISLHTEPNMLFDERRFDESDLSFNRQPGQCYTESYDLLSNMKDLRSLNKGIESVDATIDNFESSDMHDQDEELDIYLSSWSNKEDGYAQEVSVSVVEDNFTALRFKVHTNLDTYSAKLQNSSIDEEKYSNSYEIGESTCKTTKSKRSRKLFSRRKDVIIKTLLRKCRKFFIKDFNSKTGYMKQKRRLTNKIYSSLIKEYLNSVLNINCDDDTTAFLGAFLYQQDLEDNLDLFCSPNLPPAAIKDKTAKIYEILYKYSHQKFRVFSKTSEFLPIFLHFYNHGSAALTKDSEYAAGLEIIKDQLHSSLQEC